MALNIGLNSVNSLSVGSVSASKLYLGNTEAWSSQPQFSGVSTILSSNSSYTVPDGAKVMKIWSIGAGGSYSYVCDGGGFGNGRAGLVSYRHGFISTTNVSVSGSIGQPIASDCDLSTPGGSTTLSNLSTVINPSISGVVGGGGGTIFGGDGASSAALSPQPFTLWTNFTTRRDYVGINAVINAAGGNASTHTYGRLSNGVNGSAGAIVIQFLPATDLVLPFTGSGSFTIPAGYSSVKIWVVGEGGIGTVYCDGGPTTTGGRGGVSHRTWSVSGGETISYSVGRVLTGGRNWCLNPATGASSTATLNGVTITGTGGQGDGTNGTGTGGDGSGVAGNDVSSINAAYLSYSSSLINYGFPGDDYGTAFGGAVLVKCIV